jgi:hypothetical protein
VSLHADREEMAMKDMSTMNETGYYSAEACCVEEFASLTSQTVAPGDIPLADDAPKNVPVYDAKALAGHIASPVSRNELLAEWARILKNGAGVLVVKGACPDHGAIDAATRVYERIIEREKAENGGGADHFAAAGSNDRIWNSLQKLALEAPEVFVRYFATPAIDAACEAWLGPNYQMTAQVNLVHPGGKAQQAHRDYHLGFQTAEVSATYPAHVHDLSPLMTLQGGIAHCDMPLESGPTKLLPFSQLCTTRRRAVGVGGGVFLPHKPRSRPADRRAGAENAEGADERCGARRVRVGGGLGGTCGAGRAAVALCA